MSSRKVIGIDFGGTTVKLAVVEGAELLTDVFRIPTQNYDGPDALIEAITSTIAAIRENHPDVVAIGVGVPGTVNFAEGVLNNLTNVKGWTAIPLRDRLAEKTGLPTVLDNDANCMAFAEWRLGAGQGYDDVIFVTLGTGVGGGLVLGGQLYRGSNFAAGEIGQMSVDCRGVDGPYGNAGALERYIGNSQIETLAENLYASRGLPIPPDHTPEGLAAMARSGDEVALEVWREVAFYLACCLGNVVYLLNPRAIVIGGGVAHAGNLLFEPLRERLKETLTAECWEQLVIAPATFGNRAGILGASAMAAEKADEASSQWL